MPAPHILDPWLASRRFGIVIDAGSSGSRLQVYSWKDARAVNYEFGSAVAKSLPKVEKGVKEGDDWVKKVDPGISSFANDPERVADHLRPLLAQAQEIVIPSLQPETPLFLLATAGMRLLPKKQQDALLDAACKFLRFHSHFRIDGPSELGPCGSSIRIISGEEEGLFGWIAVNYLMDGFDGTTSEDQTTYGFLDMGGASTQIAFEPTAEHRKGGKGLVNVSLRFLGGTEIHHQVFVTTWLGYGTNQARERYVGHAIQEFERTRPPGSEDVLHDPCLPRNLTLDEVPVHAEETSTHASKKHTLVGTGSFTECLTAMQPLLNKSLPCNDAPCLFNGVHVPPIDFSVSHFIGVSEYWYSSEHIFNLGGPYDFVQYERAASEFCGNDWEAIVQKHDKQPDAAHLGGDGEVLKDGKVVGVGNWSKSIERKRLEMQCFKAAWLVNVLHEGIGLPRITDPGGNRSTHGQDVAESAGKKGLGRPRFQTMDTINDVAISWTLGKMVLEASKEVPVAGSHRAPLRDPHRVSSDPPAGEQTWTSKEGSGGFVDFGNFLDFNDLEDRLSQRLPTSLSRERLGFSLVSFIFWACAIVLVFCISSRLRSRLRWCQRRFRRLSGKREDRVIFDSYAEEGLNGGPSTPTMSRPPSPTNTPGRRLWSTLGYSFRRVGSLLRSQPPPPSSYSGKGTTQRTIYGTPRSNSFYTSANDSAPSPNAQFAFVPPTPTDAEQLPYTPSNPLYGLSSSRNASQVNLHSTLMPRTFTAMSRTASGVSTPVPRVDDY
ncbi:hypothetical protein EXIGLDRAFT_671419 [Exidia glandulosa HHB12029]|uniref:Nucleoside phosphatase GDA1/CD39 n=1 Tax=Exidia glandulosa HHB12029 TaxID=1314781 RepID=A0A165KEL3_EXIGL|nr:hypothetical protein EXIGLDRAFT_671419 [Exidia glandulosa HHB12029]